MNTLHVDVTTHTYWTSAECQAILRKLLHTQWFRLHTCHTAYQKMDHHIIIMSWRLLSGGRLKANSEFWEQKYKQKHNSSVYCLLLPPQSMLLPHCIWLNFLPKGNLLILILLTTNKLLENLLISPFWLKPPQLDKSFQLLHKPWLSKLPHTSNLIHLGFIPSSSLSFLAPNLLTYLVNISFCRFENLLNVLGKVSGSSISSSCAN